MVFIKYFFILLTLTNSLHLGAQNWKLNAISISMENKIFRLNAQSITTPFNQEPIDNIHYSCPNSIQVYPLHSCDQGKLSFDYNKTTYHANFTGWFNISKNSWDINISNPEGNLHINSNSKHKDILNISLKQIDISQFPQPILQALAIDPQVSTAVLTTNISVEYANLININADYIIDNLSWESEDSTLVFAESQLKGHFSLQQKSNSYLLNVNTLIEQGEGLFQDIYIAFNENPTTINTSINLDNSYEPVNTTVVLSSSKDITIVIDIPDLTASDITIHFTIEDLKKLYDGFLKSYLEILGIDEMDIIGHINGQISIVNDELSSINIELDDVSFEMDSKKTEAMNLFGQLNWHKQGDWQTSVLNWENLLLAGMPINQSQLQFEMVGGQLKLQNNTAIPLFDGKIIVNQLQLKDIFKPEIAIDFDGEVQPISLALITEKMGWPIMQGSIAGKIPGMKKVGHSITFDGSLAINVFGGSMLIDNLAIERLFGIAPVVAADITFERLNLQQITSTFDFGEITGLIVGYVKGLRVTNWKPDRLDAHIQSLKAKKIKQTISQRAIDNISSIGGIQGALSRSFLRFFDSFKYKKIGIGCKLRNSICEMSGINSDDSQGNIYHLIKGRGIPSINIIGFQKFIDWEIFLNRLLNANY